MDKKFTQMFNLRDNESQVGYSLHDLYLPNPKNTLSSIIYPVVTCPEEENDWNDRNYVLKVLKDGIYPGRVLKHASKIIRDDKTVVLEAVKTFLGRELKYASDRLKNDEEVVLEAIKTSGSSFKYASEDLKKNRNFVLKAVSLDGLSLLHADEQLKDDKEVVLQAVRNSGDSLESASESLRNDRQFVLDCCYIQSSAAFGIGSELEKEYLLARKIKSYGADLESAFEEFDIERKRLKIGDSKNNEFEKNLEDLCFKYFKRGHKNQGKIMHEGFELEKFLNLKKLSMNDPITVLEENLKKNEFDRLKKWRISSSRFLAPKLKGIIFKRFKFTLASSKIEEEIQLPRKSEIKFEDLRFFRVIGRGSFGSLYLCTHLFDEHLPGLFVMKIYHRALLLQSVKEGEEWMKRECLDIPPHQNIAMIQLHEKSAKMDLSLLPDYESYWENNPLLMNKNPTGVMLIMKYHHISLESCMDHRTIRMMKQKQKKNRYNNFGFFEPQEIYVILKGILLGALHLYNNLVVHRDLHEGNIFVHPPTNRIWIGDFGCALDLSNNPLKFKVDMIKKHEILYSVSGDSYSSLSSSGGASSHCAPEILNFDVKKDSILDYSKCDVYSCGVIGRNLMEFLRYEFFEGKEYEYWRENERMLKFVDSLMNVFDRRASIQEAVDAILTFQEFGLKPTE